MVPRVVSATWETTARQTRARLLSTMIILPPKGHSIIFHGMLMMNEKILFRCRLKQFQIILPDFGGNNTPSITWMIPFDAGMEAIICTELFNVTLPSFTLTVTLSPFTIPNTWPSCKAFCFQSRQCNMILQNILKIFFLIVLHQSIDCSWRQFIKCCIGWCKYCKWTGIGKRSN